jgi:hypothetical protein
MIHFADLFTGGDVQHADGFIHRAENDDVPVERVGLEEIINAGHSASLPLTLLSPANMPRFCRSRQSRKDYKTCVN